MKRKHSLATFETRTAAVDHMVEMGVPRNLAKAVVNEHYNYEDDGDKRDLLWEMEDDGAVILEGGVTNSDLFNVWNTYEDTLSNDKKGIYFDGELMYDIEGNKL
jgi:hypothetical protein